MVDLLDNVSSLKINLAILHESTRTETEFEVIGNIGKKVHIIGFGHILLVGSGGDHGCNRTES